MLLAEPAVRSVLAVAGSRESYLLDYANLRSRFMFGFGDGAVAALLVKGDGPNQVLGSHALTDGSLALAVKVPAGGSVAPGGGLARSPRPDTLDVADPAVMKKRLDAHSLPNFVAVARESLRRSGARLPDLSCVFPLHVKRSMHRELIAALGVPESRTVYLEDTGHMSGIDSLFALDRAARAGTLSRGDLALLIAVGTGYTWAATTVRWGL